MNRFTSIPKSGGVMKQITLSRYELRLVAAQVSRKADGFKPREAIKWGDIAFELKRSMGQYGVECRALIHEAQEVALEPITEAEMNAEIRRINRDLKDLDLSDGTETVDVVLEDGDLAFIIETY